MCRVVHVSEHTILAREKLGVIPNRCSILIDWLRVIGVLQVYDLG